jgi:TatD DNase family protein
MIETHAHIYDEQFIADFDLMIALAQESGIDHIFMPNCDQHTIEPMLACEKKYPQMCIPMMGLHPCYVKKNYQDELSIVKQYLDSRQFCAIGEIGLDFYWSREYDDIQMIALKQQLQWALDYQLPVVIHSRESTRECIDIIKSYAEKGAQGIFHCFSGSMQEAHEIVSMGFYLGIGGVVTYKKSNLPEIVKEIGIEHLVLETDSPYLAPVPYRGKRNQPVYLLEICNKIAEILGHSSQEIETQTDINAKKVFNKAFLK